MSHYIILDREATFAIAIQDALEEVGHSAEIFQDPEPAVSRLVELGADILVLDLGIAEEKQLIGTIHSVPATRSLPIVGLAETMDSQYVIDVLRLGLTDVLPRQLPLDELIARLTRSTGQPTAQLPMLQGRLAEKQLVDFLEYLRHIGKSGILRVTSSGGAGRIDIRQGAVSQARFKNLQGRAAVLAMLDQESGKFKLEESSQDASCDPSTRVDMQSVLLQASWLADKLAEHQDWIPRAGDELELVSVPDLSRLADLGDDLPFARILTWAQTKTFIRLHDLSREIDAPPQELRLVLAILCKFGHLRRRLIEHMPSTQELSSSLEVEVSIWNLLQRARDKGHTGRSLSLLLFAEPAVWPDLKALFLELSEPPFDEFAKTLRTADRGSVTVDTEIGKLVLHLHRLDPQMSGNAKTVVSACDGLLLWLGEGSDTDLLGELVERVRNTRDAVRGMVVTSDPGTLEWSRRTFASRPEWALSHRPPSKLSSVLRCFYSRVRDNPGVPTESLRW